MIFKEVNMSTEEREYYERIIKILEEIKKDLENCLIEEEII